MALRYMGVSGYAISGMAVSGIASVEQQAAVVGATQADNTVSSTATLVLSGTTGATQASNTVSAAGTISWRKRLQVRVRRAPGKIYQAGYINLPCWFQDDEGTATDPETVVLKLYSPTGSTTTYTYGTDSEFEKRGTGHYNVDFVVGQEPGRWHYVATGTDAAGRVVAREGSFIVQSSPFYDAPRRAYAYN